MKFYALAIAAAVALAPGLRADDAAPAVKAAPVVKATADLVLDDFEGNSGLARNGKAWWAGADAGKLGTTLLPNPFVAQDGGSKASPGHSGRIHGHFGKNAPPDYAWVSFNLALTNGDLRGYSALSFTAKGAGKFRVKFNKASVKDYGFPGAEFTVSKDWTPVLVKLADVTQPDWAKAVADKSLSDVEKVEFSPVENDKDYDLSIDDVTLVK